MTDDIDVSREPATSPIETINSYRDLPTARLQGIAAGPSSAYAKDCANYVLAERHSIDRSVELVDTLYLMHGPAFRGE